MPIYATFLFESVWSMCVCVLTCGITRDFKVSLMIQGIAVECLPHAPMKFFSLLAISQWPPRDWVLLSPVIAPLSKADPPCVYKREPVFFVVVERVTSCSTRRPWVNVVAMALMMWNLVSNKGHMRKISKASFLTYWVSTVPPSDWLPPWENQVRAPRPLWHNTDTRVDKICPKKMSI